ncbi:MAG TPA: UPF0182 family protein [Gemmatimonadales bacterium]|nr:UPF0182 family protein [Gemmatimonadales bacterium]
MTRRRWALLGAAALLVVVLVGGRWSAMQTAERAWAATIPNGAAYLRTLALARTVQWIVALAAVLWGMGHCYGVYRAIGSVQMPRRLGDIEIVEAVPHRLLIVVTLIAGLMYGGALAWAVGDVWRAALLASSPPHFGATDSVLHLDLGFYVGELPWARTRQGMLLIASLSAALLIAVLYTAIGSVRIQGGRLAASPHARAHLGLTLAALALAFVWGAHLDPYETVTGLVGPVTHEAITTRAAGANAVALIALITAFVSAVWGWWDRPGVVGTSWLALLITMLAAYVILPPATHTIGKLSTADLALRDDGVTLEGVAFGAAPESWSLPSLSPGSVVASIPVWDPGRIRTRALRDSAVGQGLSVYSMTLEPSGHWLLGLAPDGTSLLRVSPPPTWEQVHESVWAHAPGPLEAHETDSTLTFARAPGGPRTTWFGGGFLDYAVVDSGTMTGIPLTGTWRRLALAWTLQAPQLAQAETRGRTLVWRRDAVERFEALAPFARFEMPVPILSGDSLWWVSWGSVEAETFPLVDTVMVDGRTLRYRQPGLVGALNAVSGSTRLWLAPQTDSLTAAWARLVAPLVAPAESMPPALRRALPYPAEAFDIQARILARTIPLPDSTYRWLPLVPEHPFKLAAPGPDSATEVWYAQAFVDSTRQSTFGGILAGAMTAKGPRLFFWTPKPSTIPAPLSSDRERRSGVERVWPTDVGVVTVQARFLEPEGNPVPAKLDSVYVSVGPDVAADVSAPAALRALLRGPNLGEGTPTVSLRRARALFARMDSALATGHLARFGTLYDSLRALLRGTSRGVAPSTAPR